eukprot:TRINITY_DN9810_c0_g1_i2.p1 TRINITY_DN9810_c0_g1~~TRINITY_DN9810_c0_g1_i2.p1  ORF type:complete len:324 (+),score=59.96 TRINITY_DN9810_c0_g1_i2:78-1049(+)
MAEPDPPYVPMIAGAFSGAFARILVHPIDTVKARLQVQCRAAESGPLLFKNTFDALQRTAALEGVRGLYRGFGIAFLGSAPAGCIYFTTYEASKGMLSQMLPASGLGDFANHFTSGLLAEAASCVLFVPIDVVKERLQIQSPALKNEVYQGNVHAVSTILRQEGLHGIYRGYGATLLSFGPFSALYFVFYERCKSLALWQTQVKDADALPHWAFVACGASAGCLASFCTNPLDLVKLRLQVQRGRLAQAMAGTSPPTTGVLEWPEYRNTFHGLGLLFRHEGVAGLLRGVGARMAFHAPSTAIAFTAFEECKLLVKKMAGLSTT